MHSYWAKYRGSYGIRISHHLHSMQVRYRARYLPNCFNSGQRMSIMPNNKFILLTDFYCTFHESRKRISHCLHLLLRRFYYSALRYIANSSYLSRDELFFPPFFCAVPYHYSNNHNNHRTFIQEQNFLTVNLIFHPQKLTKCQTKKV